MKPKEFDELVRQRFDQGDFAYEAHNWDRLAEQLDGRAKKRNILMWLWMPLTGMAASVALAMGVTSLLRYGMPGQAGGGEYAHTYSFVQQPQRHDAPLAMIPEVTVGYNMPAVKPAKKANAIRTRTERMPSSWMSVTLHDVTHTAKALKDIVSASGISYANADDNVQKTVLPKSKKAPVIVNDGYNTFIPEEAVAAKKDLKLSVILTGGISQGNHTSGYAAGATVRKMLNDKVYIESDVAFAASDNTQRTQYMSYEATGGGGSLPASAAKMSSTASKTSTTADITKPVTNEPKGTIKTQDISYNLYYAQVTPGIGYKVMKRMSVGIGPDFQKMLVDNRPATSTVDRGNIQVAPMFDVGFVGKTEYALTNRIKAAVAYRKGINGLISPSDKYIDRDYLQFQMKCTIFNK